MQRVKALLKSDNSVKWLFYGDSITHGAAHTHGHRDYVELFDERVRYEMARLMDIIINTAISGHTVPLLLDSFDWRVAQFSPDVVFIMIGMNDSAGGNEGLDQFESGLTTLTEKIIEMGALPVLQTTCPIVPGHAPERSPYLDSYMDAVRSVAGKLDQPLIDHYKFWKTRPDSHIDWMANSFHPNAYGHRAFATFLYRCLDIYDEASTSCRLFFPGG